MSRRQACATDRGYSDGFTLIEVLAAFAVLSIAMVPLLGALSGDLDLLSQSRVRAQALAIATSVLETYEVDTAIGPQRTDGQRGVFAWSVAASPISESAALPGEATRTRLYAIDVEVKWGLARRVKLHTRRLGHAS